MMILKLLESYFRTLIKLCTRVKLLLTEKNTVYLTNVCSSHLINPKQLFIYLLSTGTKMSKNKICVVNHICKRVDFCFDLIELAEGINQMLKLTLHYLFSYYYLACESHRGICRLIRFKKLCLKLRSRFGYLVQK